MLTKLSNQTKQSNQAPEQYKGIIHLLRFWQLLKDLAINCLVEVTLIFFYSLFNASVLAFIQFLKYLYSFFCHSFHLCNFLQNVLNYTCLVFTTAIIIIVSFQNWQVWITVLVKTGQGLNWAVHFVPFYSFDILYCLWLSSVIATFLWETSHWHYCVVGLKLQSCCSPMDQAS